MEVRIRLMSVLGAKQNWRGSNATSEFDPFRTSDGLDL